VPSTFVSCAYGSSLKSKCCPRGFRCERKAVQVGSDEIEKRAVVADREVGIACCVPEITKAFLALGLSALVGRSGWQIQSISGPDSKI